MNSPKDASTHETYRENMFSHYVRLCLTSRYADFRNRASRVEYLCFIGMSFMLHAILFYAQILLALFTEGNSTVLDCMFCVQALLYLFLAVPACSVHVRRIRDTNMSPIFLIVPSFFIIFLNLLLLFPSLDGYSQSLSVPILAEYVCSQLLLWIEHGFFRIFSSIIDFMSFLAVMSPNVLADAPFIVHLQGVAQLLLVGLITVLMLRPGTEGENRFGPEPERTTDPGKGIVFAVSSCLVHGFARFSGRASRSEYWWFIFTICFTTGTISTSSLTKFSCYPSDPFSLYHLSTPFILIIMIPQLITLLPGLAVTVRRLHDRGQSGLWLPILHGTHLIMMFLALSILYKSHGATADIILSICLVLLNPVILLVDLILPGTKGPNKFGPDPCTGSGNHDLSSTSAP